MKYRIKNLSDTFLHPDCRWDGEYFCFEPYKNKHLKYIPVNDCHSRENGNLYVCKEMPAFAGMTMDKDVVLPYSGGLRPWLTDSPYH